MATNSLTPWEWSLQHLHLMGWPTVVFLAWRAGSYFKKLQGDVVKTIDQIDTMATNHAPHMQMYLEEAKISLNSIDKNIGLLIQKEILKSS